MAYFHILEEVRNGNPGDWQLCFQFGVYKYDPDQDTDVSQESGYRFIWRRKNGHLQGARGQARLMPDLITILLGKAAEEGWYPEHPRFPQASEGTAERVGNNDRMAIEGQAKQRIDKRQCRVQHQRQ